MASAARRVRHIPAEASAVVLVCRKCSKKLKGGFGPDGDERLSKALRKGVGTMSAGKRRKLRRSSLAVLEVPCLDLCPKGAVVALRGDRPGDWLTIPRGTPVAEIAAHLGLAPVTQPSEEL